MATRMTDLAAAIQSNYDAAKTAYDASIAAQAAQVVSDENALAAAQQIIRDGKDADQIAEQARRVSEIAALEAAKEAEVAAILGDIGVDASTASTISGLIQLINETDATQDSLQQAKLDAAEAALLAYEVELGIDGNQSFDDFTINVA